MRIVKKCDTDKGPISIVVWNNCSLMEGHGFESSCSVCKFSVLCPLSIEKVFKKKITKLKNLKLKTKPLSLLKFSPFLPYE